jgi:hypothetical protein
MPTSSVVSAPPPTLNNLDAHQRSRLLRSTRKLEALLGTTPHLLEPSSSSSRLHASSAGPGPASTTATRTHRRERRAFGDSASPSSRSSKYDEDGNSASSSLDKPSSPFGEKRGLLTKKNSLNKGSKAKTVSTKGVDVSRPKSREKKQDSTPNNSATFPHPLVLSLLSVPVSQSDARLSHGHITLSLPTASSFTSPSSVKSPKPSSSHRPNSLPSPTFATNPDIQTSALASTPTTPGTPIPLSPLSPTFYSNQSDSPEHERERERDVRRKKIAKLTRTLGENIPPELVFRTSSVHLEMDQGLKNDLILEANTPKSKSKPSDSSKSLTTSKSGSQSQSVRAPPPSLSLTSSKHKKLKPAPPIVVVGPPPTPGARRSRKSPSTPQSQESQSEVHLGAELVIPPPPSSPAPLPPSALVEKYRLEREKAQEALAQSRLAPTSALGESKTYTHHHRSLSLGSGIDLLGEYWAREQLEMGDGGRGSGASRSDRKVDEREQIEEAEPRAASAIQQWPPSVSMVFHPNPYQIQSPSSQSPAKQNPTRHKTHRLVHSSPSPRDAYFSSTNDKLMPTEAEASSNPAFPLLRRKSSKSKGKPAETKAEVKRSNSLKLKSTGRAEVVRTIEGASRSGTPHPSDSTDAFLSPPECGRRKEREWSGEWNRKDMDEVVKGLRGLKAR